MEKMNLENYPFVIMNDTEAERLSGFSLEEIKAASKHPLGLLGVKGSIAYYLTKTVQFM